ncbi:MAG: thioredoxin family protein [Ignavibacteriaceae bacterium]|jgi:thioredoxin-like negative regulator of GroEL|nr:thioredoxin family protein [Ignavibacteriaceae bacterium]MCW8817261.1 thioredoxin family protein [Ignavibacteriaceae bacterium]MCW8960462.1 thioredoxin family protein [Ignavibacteriaceae bacterium]
MDDLINYKKNEKRLLTEISTSCNPILVEVRAEWSGGSHLMDLIINKIEEEFRHQIKVVRIDFEVHKELLSQFGIENAPALLLISKGQIIEVIKETLSRKSLEQIVRNLINRNGSSIREKKSTNS